MFSGSSADRYIGQVVAASGGGTGGAYVQIAIPARARPDGICYQVVSYAVHRWSTGWYSRDRAPAAWTLEGSVDGVTWTPIDARENIAWSGSQTAKDGTGSDPDEKDCHQAFSVAGMSALCAFLRFTPLATSYSGAWDVGLFELKFNVVAVESGARLVAYQGDKAAGASGFSHGDGAVITEEADLFAPATVTKDGVVFSCSGSVFETWQGQRLVAAVTNVATTFHYVPDGDDHALTWLWSLQGTAGPVTFQHLAEAADGEWLVSGTQFMSGYGPEKCFDGIAYTDGLTDQEGAVYRWISRLGGTVEIGLRDPLVWSGVDARLGQYRLYQHSAGYSCNSRAPAAWTLEGSTDGETWTVLDAVTDFTWVSQSDPGKYGTESATAHEKAPSAFGEHADNVVTRNVDAGRAYAHYRFTPTASRMADTASESATGLMEIEFLMETRVPDRPALIVRGTEPVPGVSPDYGTHVFADGGGTIDCTAPAAGVLGGRVLRCRGYVVETRADDGSWGDPVTNLGARAFASAKGERDVRLTWLWERVRVLAETAGYVPTAEDLEHWLCVVASLDGRVVGEKSFYFSRLPVLYLNTDSGLEITDKENYVPARLRIQGNGEFAQQYDGATEVKGRGNSSWTTFAQRPYKLKLDKKTNLFGYGKQKHWVLISCFADNAFMRNRHGMELAKEVGVAGMDMTWVAVVLNGRYYGVEMLSEHIRVDANRIDIFDWESKAEDVADALFDAAGAAAGWTKDDQSALEEKMSSDFSWITTGEVAYRGVAYRLADYGLAEDWDLTGGYLYEMEDRYDEPSKFLTALKKTRIQFSKPEFAQTDASMFAAAQKVWNDVEAAYLSVDHYSADGEKPLSELADLDSMAGYWLTLECLGNVDCCAGHSRYSYVDAGGKLVFGPVWDFDYGGGSIAVQDPVYGDSRLPDHWAFKIRDEVPVEAGRAGTCFFVEWMDDPLFVAKAYGLYWRKVRPWLAAELAQGGGMDEKVAYLTEAGDAHDALYKAKYGRWGFGGVNGDVAKYRAYLTTRLAWLDAQFASIDTLMASLVTTNLAVSAHPYEKSNAISFAVAGGFATNEVCGTDFAVETADGSFTLSLATAESSAARADVYLNGVNCAQVALSDGAGAVSVGTAGVEPAAAGRHLVSVICRDGSGSVVARSYATVLAVGAGGARVLSGRYPDGARVTLTEPSTYVLDGADFGAPLVFSGTHPLVLELAAGTQNAAPQVAAEGPVTFTGAGALTLSGSNDLIRAEGDVVVSNGVIALEVAAVADGDSAVVMKGNYFQYGGEVTLGMSGGCKTYGLRWKDVKDVEAVIAGGSFAATVASGEGSAAFKSNKGSNDFTLKGDARLTAELAAADARVVDAAGNVKFKGNCEVGVTATAAATHARAFKSEKNVAVADSATVEAELLAAESEILSSDKVILVEGGVLCLTADDDCLSAQTDIVISGGMVQALSMSGDAIDANRSVVISNGYVFATTCASDHEGIDVDPAEGAGPENRLVIVGGTVVAVGGAGRLHVPDAGSVDFYANAEIGSLRKYLVLTSVRADGLERLSVNLKDKRIASGFSLLAVVPDRVGTYGDTATKPSEDTPKGKKLHDKLDGVFVTKVANGTAPGAEVELEATDEAAARIEAAEKVIVLSSGDVEAGVEASYLRMEAQPYETGGGQVRYRAVVAVNPETVPAPTICGAKPMTVVTGPDGTEVEIGVGHATRGLWYGCEATDELSDPWQNDIPSFVRATGDSVSVKGSKRSGASAFYRIKVLSAKPVK